MLHFSGETSQSEHARHQVAASIQVSSSPRNLASFGLQVTALVEEAVLRRLRKEGQWLELLHLTSLASGIGLRMAG